MFVNGNDRVGGKNPPRVYVTKKEMAQDEEIQSLRAKLKTSKEALNNISQCEEMFYTMWDCADIANDALKAIGD